MSLYFFIFNVQATLLFIFISIGLSQPYNTEAEKLCERKMKDFVFELDTVLDNERFNSKVVNDRLLSFTPFKACNIMRSENILKNSKYFNQYWANGKYFVGFSVKSEAFIVSFGIDTRSGDSDFLSARVRKDN